MSRVGKKSITLPDKVTVKVNGSSVQVEGPKGKLSWTLPEGITASVEGNQLSVDRAGESRQLRAPARHEPFPVEQHGHRRFRRLRQKP